MIDEDRFAEIRGGATRTDTQSNSDAVDCRVEGGWHTRRRGHSQMDPVGFEEQNRAKRRRHLPLDQQNNRVQDFGERRPGGDLF